MKNLNHLTKFNKFLLSLFLIVTIIPFFSGKSQTVTNAFNEEVPKAVYNTVVFLTFNEEGDSFPKNFFEDIYATYETASVGVKNYFLKQSLNKFEVKTSILYSNGESVRSDNPVEYYKPRYKWINGGYSDINKLGYDNRYFDAKGNAVAPKHANSKISVEGAYREQLLVREIIEKCDLPAHYKTDYNNDELVDSLVIITDVLADADWGDVLWSHSGYAHDFSDNTINSYYLGDYKKSDLQSIEKAILAENTIGAYNMIALSHLVNYKVGDYAPAVSQNEKHLYNVGLLCHEMMHVLGLYDYYSYERADYESVGEFDLMGKTGVVPQYSLAYLRQKMGWLTYDNLLYINDSGDYTLKAVNGDGGLLACKIVLSDYVSTGEFFMAEFRSQSGATSDNPFDGGLSGNGLILYRVNEKNAYINSSGMQSVNDFGNMYGDDEVYVYRMGNGKTLNDPTGYTSYALLGNQVPPIMTNFMKYDNTTFGNLDKSLTINDLSVSLTENSQTILHYGNGKNSGIVFSNVKINEDGTVSFHVDLPEKQGNMPILNSSDVNLVRFFNGKQRLYWNTTVKSGDTYVLILRSTDRLKTLAENGNSHIAFEDFKNGTFSYYTTLYSKKLPLAEKYLEIPEFNEEALVFIALQSQNGNCSVRYVGCLKNKNESFSDYVRRIIDPLYIYIAVVALLLVLTILTYFILGRKNQYKRKK